jgi:N-acetylglucosamine malate deacetylase 1
MSNSVAVIAAHADDEVLGCGGSIAKFIFEGRDVHVLILADGISSRHDLQAEKKLREVTERNIAAETANKILGTTTLTLLALPDNRMDSIDLLDVVKIIEDFIEKHHPVTVLTHHAGDVNIDHRVVHDAVIAACRPIPGSCVNELLFFEIASSTEWRPPASALMFSPNFFINISDHMDTKLRALAAYKEEHARSLIAVTALAQWRGASCGAERAEAYVLGRKIIT